MPKNITQLHIEDVCLSEHPYSKPYSWFKKSTVRLTPDADSTPTIDVQWLRFQGVEFRLTFQDAASRNQAFSLLLTFFASRIMHHDHEGYKNISDHSVDASRVNGFDIAQTASPLALLAMLKWHCPDIALVFVAQYPCNVFKFGSNWPELVNSDKAFSLNDDITLPLANLHDHDLSKAMTNAFDPSLFKGA